MKIGIWAFSITLIMLSIRVGADTITLSAMSDTGLYRNSAEDRDNFGGDKWIEIDNATEHALVKWDLSRIPQGSKVISARIDLYGFVSDDRVAHSVDGYLATHDWSQGTGVNIGHYPWSGLPRNGASWDTYDGFDAHPYDTWQTPGGDCENQATASGETSSGRMSYLGDPDGPLTLNATPIARIWIDMNRPNYGVLLKCTDARFKFESREAKAPRLVIDYTPPQYREGS